MTTVDPKTIPAIIRFPWPWPPGNPVLLQAQSTPYFTVQVYGLTDGTIKILIKYPDSKQHDFVYQKVSIPCAGLVIMILVVDEGNVTLYLNGEPLLLRHDAKDQTKHINVSPAPPQPALHLDLPDEKLVSGDEWWFIRSLGELMGKLSTSDKYEILQATLPLRKLLLEGQPLVTIVNRSYRKKLWFKVLPPAYDLSPQSEFVWQTIDPSLIPQAPTVDVSLKGLLQTVCLTIKGDPFSVHDIITTCAYAKGGLHRSKPKTQKQKDLVKLDEEHKLFDQEPSIAAMAGIMAVVLRGLEPLVEAIKDRLNNP